ncbi:E3 ubiquitin-protein ligase [Apostasia shenzhenica]|uniref:RING-type E3 ubiquitin transferase n=1 Tax=Apostasia shenzhenica TaxID=1088818 RepID=A0A2I0A4A5_9ASPA|nr:E3 ubiquitin-protein ligase [Apostasia shenzhenica]
MGSICSCFCLENLEEYRNPYGLVYRHCFCLRYLAQQLTHMYSLLLQRDEHSAPLSLQPSSSLASVAPTVDDSFSDTFRSPPRPLPYDDPRCSSPARRHTEPLDLFDGESEPLRMVNSDVKAESTSIAAKSGGYIFGVSRKSSSKHPIIEITGGATYDFPSSEEDDVCPTCLDEYTTENPMIVTSCSHHFHLGCIYEWMERSELCPVCGKVMIFNEAS